ncbi:putative protein CHAPERONE-LIKE PROTEIN OF POR1, chloroplastic [Cocos nucifera]|uniref:Uncharacterized protein n=1 Tax=Cocos nucifera TaxID=13894 RepID=A0A8K0MUT2_COCNU|nr:putative protein CHAPERONE-LIKE PROTEIN OF POR1, chloroplastic [Cocos nucifera]
MAYESLDRITAEKISAVGIPSDDAGRLHGELARILQDHGNSGPETWREISRSLLSPDLPFPFHQMMYYGSYKGYDSVTPPAWIPEKANDYVAVEQPIEAFTNILFSSGTTENIPKFPRMNVRNPYKRLGVSRDASEEEIREARNFLLEQYAGHERSEESIEAAYEKILMASFRERKKSKINLKSRLKKKVEESPTWVKTLISFVELPPTDIILRRLFLFAFMGTWSIMNSAESGPAFQVALSLLACIYFLNDKMKNVVRASITGFGALVVGWIVGSLLVPMIPSVLLQPTWTLELVTSLNGFEFAFSFHLGSATVTAVFPVTNNFEPHDNLLLVLVWLIGESVTKSHIICYGSFIPKLVKCHAKLEGGSQKVSSTGF